MGAHFDSIKTQKKMAGGGHCRNSKSLATTKYIPISYCETILYKSLD
jgi:hypothetical protein